jgi:hypothetical protein
MLVKEVGFRLSLVKDSVLMEGNPDNFLQLSLSLTIPQKGFVSSCGWILSIIIFQFYYQGHS